MVQQQIDLFSTIMPTFKIDRKVRLIELFAGIGAQARSLELLGANFEHWRAIEFDKYAIASYNAVHGTNFETSDVTKIHASDLGIEEREILLHPHIFLPVSGFIECGEKTWDAEGLRHTFRSLMGSRKAS